MDAHGVGHFPSSFQYKRVSDIPRDGIPTPWSRVSVNVLISIHFRRYHLHLLISDRLIVGEHCFLVNILDSSRSSTRSSYSDVQMAFKIKHFIVASRFRHAIVKN